MFAPDASIGERGTVAILKHNSMIRATSLAINYLTLLECDCDYKSSKKTELMTERK